ncbi:phosphoribulokinase [Mycobacterium xenopi]|nr:phosphoribulokinase [Mycobacterium xenopi]MDA3639171.1 phosphoribulokinase [Mycobacterium xenopi]MDA3657543.1 phosphoribulokinase [Mycobacterium xenopi]MDA3661435.1 phosphoribulokinase [Mycobacterium xenopi]ORX20760.1 phosphoribulokinase [Mycobacterium xenopi]
MPDKTFQISRVRTGRRPVMLAVVGDSAAGKTTITAGLVEALGPDRCVSISADDYHRFDRAERRGKPFTPLHPDCNYIDILEQHLQLLATGHPILKPVYDHSIGRRVRPELVEPKDFIIVHGLLPLHSKLARACFDVTVFLDPPEEIRRAWKINRDTVTRGYTTDQVMAEIVASEAESAKYVRPQRAHADIVVRFAPIATRNDPPDTPLSAELILRPTIRQPDLTEVLQPDVTRTIHLRLARDTDGRPVDSVHIHGYTTAEENAAAEKMLWEALGDPRTAAPKCLGLISPNQRSTPLAITQIILLHHLLHGAR